MPDDGLELMAVLADVLENMKRMEEMARGYREEMKRQGWSDHAAEQVSAAFLQSLIGKALQ